MLWLATAITLIVVLAMPSLAEAHPGHRASSDVAMAAAKVAPVSSAEAPSRPAVQAELHAAVEVQSGNAGHACGSSLCCCNASCAGAFLIAAQMPVTEPVWISRPSWFGDAMARTGLDPEGLSKPPRSLV